MPTKSLRKLAGYIAIELLCALGASAADYEFSAGYAESGRVRAIVVQDRRGQRAVIAAAAFDVPPSVSDVIAAQAIKDYSLERASLLIYSIASGAASPEEARTAIGAALSDLKPAFLVYGNGRLTVSSYDGKCRIALTADASMVPCTNPVGNSLGGRIRSALRMVDQLHGLSTRDQAPPQSIAIQAISLGGSVVIFSGPSNVGRTGKGMIQVLTPSVEDDPRLAAAVGEVFLRVGGRPR